MIVRQWDQLCQSVIVNTQSYVITRFLGNRAARIGTPSRAVCTAYFIDTYPPYSTPSRVRQITLIIAYTVASARATQPPTPQYVRRATIAYALRGRRNISSSG